MCKFPNLAKNHATRVVYGSLAFLQITFVLPIITVALATFKECACMFALQYIASLIHNMLDCYDCD